MFYFNLIFNNNLFFLWFKLKLVHLQNNNNYNNNKKYDY